MTEKQGGPFTSPAAHRLNVTLGQGARGWRHLLSERATRGPSPRLSGSQHFEPETAAASSAWAAWQCWGRPVQGQLAGPLGALPPRHQPLPVKFDLSSGLSAPSLLATQQLICLHPSLADPVGPFIILFSFSVLFPTFFQMPRPHRGFMLCQHPRTEQVEPGEVIQS